MSTLTLYRHDSSVHNDPVRSLTTGINAGSAYGNIGRTSKNEFASALAILQQGASGSVNNDAKRHDPLKSVADSCDTDFAQELQAAEAVESTPKLDALREKYAVLQEDPVNKDWEVLEQKPNEDDWSILDAIGDGLMFAAKLATRVAVGKIF